VSTAVSLQPAEGSDALDSLDLAEFGYTQQLRRGLGSYASFAAGFSFVSILTTVFQLFSFGYSFGGPAFFWTWPMVFAGQFLVAMCFAELAARYPISGCVYQWSRRMSSRLVGHFAGWTMLIGQVVSVSAAAIALQVVLPSVWSGFQLVGGDPALTTKTGSSNAVVLGAILIVVTTIVSAIGVRIMSLINCVGVTCELIGVAALIAMLFAHAKRGPAVVVHTDGAAGGGSYVWPFLVSALMAAYVMYGFDSAGELSEETRNPRKTAPKAILKALAVSGAGGAALLLAALMAAPSLTDGQLATGGLPYVVTSRLGEGDLRVHAGDPDRGLAADLLDGSRRSLARSRSAVQDLAADWNACAADRADRHRGDRDPRRERRAGAAVHGDHQCGGRDRVPGVSVGDSADAGQASQWSAARSGGPLLARPVRHAGQRARRRLRTVHGGEHGLAARGGLRPERWALVPAVLRPAVLCGCRVARLDRLPRLAQHA
jgi:Amino acid permease